MSDKPDDEADRTKSGRTMFPRLSLTAVGNSNLISLANAASLVDGSRDVVTEKSCVSSL
jgi:hypothetical protein